MEIQTSVLTSHFLNRHIAYMDFRDWQKDAFYCHPLKFLTTDIPSKGETTTHTEEVHPKRKIGMIMHFFYINLLIDISNTSA